MPQQDAASASFEICHEFPEIKSALGQIGNKEEASYTRFLFPVRPWQARQKDRNTEEISHVHRA
jgi:hypothetical protein